MKISFEECETGYDTARSVECYERLKGKRGASLVQPLSTGATFAITERRRPTRSRSSRWATAAASSADGIVFKWNFPIAGHLLGRLRQLMQTIGKKEGGLDKLKGKKITLVYHDRPYGKEPIPLLQERAKLNGFDLQLLPVAAPGRRAEGAWLQIRQSRPDYVLLWGWGVMNSTALKEAHATGYPREKMYGVWWAGAEPDVKDVGEGAKGYNAVTLQHGPSRSQVRPGHSKMVHDKGQGTGPKRRSARCSTSAAR